MSTKRFTLTAEHIKLLRSSYVSWGGSQNDPASGSARIDAKRPYGNSFVLGDIAECLGEDYYDDDAEEPIFPPDAERRLWRLHRETETALQIVLATGQFEPGEYVADQYSRNWRRA